jgi:hypothetical protein
MASTFDPESTLHPTAHAAPPVRPLTALYEEDEAAWLEAMALLIAERRYGELDYEHLSEFLTDMARRDRREVLSRLKQLLTHLLKWDHQPTHRSSGWMKTISDRRSELNDLCQSGTLKNHARDVLAEAYRRAVRLASAESGLSEDVFPQDCPWSLEEVLGEGPRA